MDQVLNKHKALPPHNIHSLPSIGGSACPVVIWDGPLLSHQSHRKQNGEQRNMMEDQQEFFPHEWVDRSKGVSFIVLVTFDPEAMVMAEVHGEDVVWHVGHAVPNDKMGGQPVSGTEYQHNGWTDRISVSKPTEMCSCLLRERPSVNTKNWFGLVVVSKQTAKF